MRNFFLNVTLRLRCLIYHNFYNWIVHDRRCSYSFLEHYNWHGKIPLLWAMANGLRMVLRRWVKLNWRANCVFIFTKYQQHLSDTLNPDQSIRNICVFWNVKSQTCPWNNYCSLRWQQTVPFTIETTEHAHATIMAWYWYWYWSAGTRTWCVSSVFDTSRVITNSTVTFVEQ